MLGLVTTEAWAVPAQLHTNVGMINGSYAGPVTNTISVPQSLNVEYEFFVNTQRSWAIRSQIAIDQTSGRLAYYGTFFGHRYYFMSTGMIEDVVGTDTHIESTPKWRYYYGWDFGISQVVLQEVAALTVVSSLYDIGGVIGTIYQLGSTWGIDAQLGYSYGWGFSSVAVTGTTMKLFFGGVYYFH